ncbi:response regulator [Calidifontibacillus erzurumensis]|uniref:response regulator n=1 Tax=Calidifontibacillus erzurumensis TaxID=2741433 RepID=UPI0035B56037
MTRILIKSKNDLFSKMLNQVLQNKGYDVFVSDIKTSVMHEYRKSKPDVIIYNSSQNKYVLEDLLKLQPFKPIVKVLFVLEHGTTNFYKDLAYANGADGILVKPFDMDTLINLLEKILQQRKHMRKMG